MGMKSRDFIMEGYTPWCSCREIICLFYKTGVLGPWFRMVLNDIFSGLSKCYFPHATKIVSKIKICYFYRIVIKSRSYSPFLEQFLGGVFENILDNCLTNDHVSYGFEWQILWSK